MYPPDKKIKKIIHIDMDAFYASVEQRENPTLQGKPVAVGRAKEERGVIATANYEARKFGVHSAMSSAEALKLCPQLILIHPNFEKYREISSALYELYCQYTDLVEPIALDECYLDVTGKGSATLIAKELKQKIRKKFGLTASAGVSINKLIAKIASDYKKPDGLLVIEPEEVSHFISSINICDIHGVGQETAKKIEKQKLGKTCADLQQLSLLEMIKCFGSYGEKLYYFIRGIDDRPVTPLRESKSIGTEITVKEDIYDLPTLMEILESQLESIIGKANGKKLRWKTITLKLKYKEFVQVTRSYSFSDYTDDNQSSSQQLRLLATGSDIEISRGIRLAGVTLSNFEPRERQLELLFP